MSDESRLKPDDDGGDNDHRPIVDGALLVAGGESTPLFEPIDTAFDDVAPGRGRPVERQRASWPGRPLGALVTALRDRMRDLPRPQEPPTAEIAVAFVRNHSVGPGAGSSPSAGAWNPNAVEHRRQLGAIMALSRRNHDRERASLAVTGEMELGGESTAAASQALVRRVLKPLFSAA